MGVFTIIARCQFKVIKLVHIDADIECFTNVLLYVMTVWNKMKTQTFGVICE